MASSSCPGLSSAFALCVVSLAEEAGVCVDALVGVVGVVIIPPATHLLTVQPVRSCSSCSRTKTLPSAMGHELKPVAGPIALPLLTEVLLFEADEVEVGCGGELKVTTYGCASLDPLVKHDDWDMYALWVGCKEGVYVSVVGLELL